MDNRESNPLAGMINELIQNPDTLADLPDTKAIELYKELNKYGVYIPVNTKGYFNFSITNWSDQYQRKLLMSALIGYLFRVLDEYEPYEVVSDNHPELKDVSVENLAEAKAKLLKANNEQAKSFVRVFLNRNFNFNPDWHVSRATSDSKSGDSSRVDNATARMQAMTLDNKYNTLMKNMTKEGREQGLRASLSVHIKDYYNSLCAMEKTLTEKIKAISTLLSEAVASTNVAEKLAAISDSINSLSSMLVEVREKKSFYETTAKVMQTHDILPVYDVNPPSDVFFHFNRYYENNFEALKEFVTNFYNEKDDLEYAIQIYDKFENLPDAKEFSRKYEDKTISTIYTIENGCWHILGPYKKNMERIDFYNKNAEPIRRLLEQMEKDQKLGEDLLKKRVRREKAKQTATVGPDAAGLEQYKSAVGTIESFGAKEVLTNDDKKKLHEAERIKQMYEVPENAIQVDYFTSNPKEGTFTKSHFYTEAEAPKMEASDKK